MTVCGAVRAFRNLPASALTKIAQIASPPTTYQAGELISDGQGEQALLLVVAGKAKVSLLSVDGNENILYLLKGGELLNSFGARLAELGVDNSRLHLLDAKERLYAYLLDWERDYQSSTYQLAMTKGEVANWLGITPANLSRCLKQLVTEGKTSGAGPPNHDSPRRPIAPRSKTGRHRQRNSSPHRCFGPLRPSRLPCASPARREAGRPPGGKRPPFGWSSAAG